MNSIQPQRQRQYPVSALWLLVSLLTIGAVLFAVGPEPFSTIALPRDGSPSAGTVFAASSEEWPLVVHFFDVGQGDAILFQGEDFTILIDAGRHDRADVVPHLMRAGVHFIDLFIGTHPHADHIGQCAAVVQRFPVGEVWLSGDVHTTLTFERCLDAILESDAGYHEPRAGEVYEIGSARIEVLHPSALTGGFNDNSIVVRIIYGDVAFLMTGDAEALAEASMVGRGQELSAQVLKVGHHGSRTSSTEAFLRAVRPALAIYSAEKDNPYGHPHKETLRTFAALGIPLYGTDVNGTVRVGTDGREFTVFVERGEAVVAGGHGDVGIRPGSTRWDEPSQSSTCAPPLVDLNTAPIDELVRIMHVGPTIAGRIVDARPFESVEDLLRVSGIGTARLADILAQGLACVDVP